MKRPRSYGEDLDEDVGEKGLFKDWARRDQDSDRSDRSSHRRFYSKAENGRKGSSSSSYDRSLDEDREPLRSSRKRFDQEQDAFDRRKGGFDRYRDGSDRSIQVSSPRSIQVSSPRIGYGSDRIHRSESFSFSRRDYPKGFRSERDRPRREGSSGSSWRRSVGGKEAVDEEEKLVAVDPVGRGHHVVSEERGRTRSKDSSSRERSMSVEVKKPEEVRRESCSSSEMEEGELEPDLEPEPESDLDAQPLKGAEDCRELETENRLGSKEGSQDEAKSSSEEKLVKLGFCEEDACDGKVVEVALDLDKGTDSTQSYQNNSTNELDEKNREELEEEAAATVADKGGEKQEIVRGDHSCSSSPGHEPEGPRKDWLTDEGRKFISVAVSTPLEENLEGKQTDKRGIDLQLELEVEQKEERLIDLEDEQKEVKVIDLEVEPEYTVSRFDSSRDVAVENNTDEVTVRPMTDKQKENGRDKGKSLVIPLSSETNFMEGEDAMEGPSRRGFELVFRSEVARPEKLKCDGIVIGKHKDEKLKLEPLDLSLGLPGVPLDDASHDPNPKPNSPGHARSIQSLPSSFRTNSDGFTASISFSGSQPFVHNPSCSLTQNSTENYEHSVGSHPIFQGIDQVSNGTIWQGQPSNEPRRKGGVVPLYQRMLLNGNADHHSSYALNGQYHSQANGLSRQSSLPKQLSPTHSRGSRETSSAHSKDKKMLTRHRSSSGSLFRGEQRDSEQTVLNGGVVVERIVAKIVSEPAQVVCRTIQEMTEQSVSYLKKTIGEMVVNRDKHGQLSSLQEALQRRSDLNLETLAKCPRVLLEVLVSLKTGLPEFLQNTNSVTSSDLAEMFLNLKCRNLACRSSLPVDECDCKVCSQKIGFCSACMCLICSKFDLASNTCSWVGCDVCLHWCHTDCGLRDSHIRNGRSVTGALGATEMQFHCVACDHPSEMFGFVKEVFKNFAKDWKAETLAKELEYVRRIFSASDDARGKRLHDVADQLLVKLENKANLPEVISYIMAFLAESDSNFSSSPSTFSPKELPRKNIEGSNGIVGSSKEAMWLPSVSAVKSPRLENAGNVLPSLDCERAGRRAGDVELQRNLERKPVVDELDSIVKFKQAEAKMYQARADDARREAEGLKRIAIAKNEKIEEEYVSRIAKLHLTEAEERRRQKLEELQVLDRVHREYFNMKMRMETDIKDLLLKMEATKCNLNT